MSIDVFDNLEIEFGPTQYDHIYRRHSDFSRARRKRQDETTIEIPSDTPNNVTDVSFDLASELLNYTFGVDDFLGGLDSIANLPLRPSLPVEIGCKNCSTRGQITLTQGKIKIDTKQIDLVPDVFEGGDDGKEIGSVITGGYMDLAVTGIGARLEMFARPVKSGSYEIALFPLPVLGFVIPGIGQAGASFEPRISADFEIDGELAVNYGIDVATVRITISNTSASNTEAPTPPPIVIISAPGSKPCNSSTAETPVTSITAPATPVTTTGASQDQSSQDQSSHSSSATSLTSEPATSAETKSEATSTPSTTSPPKVEESKGFMAPPHSATGTGDAATSTGPSEFTGAAMPGLVAPLGRREAGWQIAVLAASVGFGMLFT
ncbi:hypothetical protein N0V86_001720 [Didymella sp. IMI 355093]|nr:hypothetical protein N0V86_001720 [Didymella sp. IMI 355093]